MPIRSRWRQRSAARPRISSPSILPGLDIAQHALLSPGDGQAASASALVGPLQAIRDYYVALDRLLALTSTASPEEVLFVVTAPGRVAGGGEGRLGARGPIVREPAQRSKGSVTDVSPTILYALGVPASRETGWSTARSGCSPMRLPRGIPSGTCRHTAGRRIGRRSDRASRSIRK